MGSVSLAANPRCWSVERDFADRTTRVIIEKAAPFYAVRGILVLTWPKSISML
jgi:hypothetical protein